MLAEPAQTSLLLRLSGRPQHLRDRNGQFTADELPNGAPELSPLGRQHLELAAWARKHPERGVLYTPVAFMLDFYNGWNMPRHLYRSDRYKIWGKLPYEKGDYLIDGIFRMVWPGYEDCSYLRNERGFITATPFGDIFDVVTNRCHPSILRQYAAVMLLGDVEITADVAQTLGSYVRDGGDLLIDARTAGKLPEELTGVRPGSPGSTGSGCLTHVLCCGTTYSEQPYRYSVLRPGSATALVINERGHALLTVNKAGQGRVVVCAADHWMTKQLTYRQPEIVNMEPPHRLLKGLRRVLEGYFASFCPVSIEPPGLNVRTCFYDRQPKRLLVGLMNNNLFADWQGTLDVRAGDIASVQELWRHRPLSMTAAVGLQIPAGEVAILDIRLK